MPRIVAGGPSALNLGLQFELEPGWKIYWRSPGEAGYPPTVDWSGSENLAEVQVNWPVPHRFSLFGFETFGYKDAVILPIDARAERPGEPVRLHAAITYLTCNEICITAAGRTDDQQITVCDLTGVAVQDAQIAWAVYSGLGPTSAAS